MSCWCRHELQLYHSVDMKICGMKWNPNLAQRQIICSHVAAPCDCCNAKWSHRKRSNFETDNSQIIISFRVRQRAEGIRNVIVRQQWYYRPNVLAANTILLPYIVGRSLDTRSENIRRIKLNWVQPVRFWAIFGDIIVHNSFASLRNNIHWISTDWPDHVCGSGSLRKNGKCKML